MRNRSLSHGAGQRRLSESLTISDLCVPAAQQLLADLGWQKESEDALIMVTQTPDYLVPATAYIIQDRLGLSKECYAFDISLGCSGWIYSLCAIAGLLSSESMKSPLARVSYYQNK